jgi:diacylglycerol kinase family enzyme
MTAKVILNPYANRWNAKERWPEAQAALKASGVDFEMVVLERPRHVIELAAEAASQGFSPIIAAGGDGTIGETVNGLDLQADGDTHVRNTSEVGRIRVVDYKSKGAINKRTYVEVE